MRAHDLARILLTHPDLPVVVGITEVADGIPEIQDAEVVSVVSGGELEIVRLDLITEEERQAGICQH